MPGAYVADASLFPASSGVNPMITIMALARYVAKGMTGRP
jgi:choline dehydrogenase-like flavoprotein